jgi:hypothetical protein
MEENYSHIIQSAGILKTFTVAKLMLQTEIEAIKEDVKKRTSTQEEFERVFAEEFAKIANMHDPDNPIPGIIYSTEPKKRGKKMLKLVKQEKSRLKKLNLTKSELCFYINGLVNMLELTQEDFEELNPKDFGFED